MLEKFRANVLKSKNGSLPVTVRYLKNERA